jgi:uncharacterized protein
MLGRLLGFSLILLALPALAHASDGPSFDCAKAKSPVERAICSDQRLAAADRKLTATYHAGLVQLSNDGQRAMRDGQRQWLKMIEAFCSNSGPSNSTGMKECLTSAYSDRQSRLEAAVKTVGGLRFRAVDVYRVTKASSDDTGSGANPGFDTTDLSYPLIDAPKDMSERKFNKHMEQIAAGENQNGNEDGDEDVDQSYDQITVNDRLISVDTTSSMYPHGAAHGQYASTMVHWLRKQGRELTASDVFLPRTSWRDFLQYRCFAEVAHFGFAKSAKDLADMVKDPTRWIFESKGLTVRFMSYEVASYADGQPIVTIPWKALSPYLAPGAQDFSK